MQVAEAPPRPFIGGHWLVNATISRGNLWDSITMKSPVYWVGVHGYLPEIPDLAVLQSYSALQVQMYRHTDMFEMRKEKQNYVVHYGPVFVDFGRSGYVEHPLSCPGGVRVSTEFIVKIAPPRSHGRVRQTLFLFLVVIAKRVVLLTRGKGIMTSNFPAG